MAAFVKRKMFKMCEHFLSNTDSFMQGNLITLYRWRIGLDTWLSNYGLYHYWALSLLWPQNIECTFVKNIVMPAQAARVSGASGHWQEPSGFWTPGGSDVWCGLVWIHETGHKPDQPSVHWLVNSDDGDHLNGSLIEIIRCVFAFLQPSILYLLIMHAFS